MAKVESKQPIIQEINELLSDAKAAVLVDYAGLNVEQDTRLRRQLREAGVTYKVYKNTMMRFAIKDTPYESLGDLLQGPTAVAVSSEDATTPASILYKFAKDAPALELKGGVVDGIYYGRDTIEVIATIPSREELLGRLLGSMQSPIANFARVLNQIAEKGGASETAPQKPSVEEPAAEEAPAEEAAPEEELAAEEASAEEPAAEEAPAEEAAPEEATE